MEDIENQYHHKDKHQETAVSDEINLLDYFSVVFKYRWMILSICVIAVVTTGIKSLRSPKMYSAYATLVPPIENLQRSRLAGDLGLRGGMIANIMGAPNIAGLYMGLLKSRAVEDAIVDRLDLMQVYDAKKRYIAREKLRDSTTIKAEDNIIRITVKDSDPNRAAAIANAYVDELDRQNKRLSSGQATNQRIFLDNRLKEIEGKLSKIDDILSKEAEIQEMLYQMLMREHELVKMEEAKNMPTIQVLDRAIAPEMRLPRNTKRKVMTAGVVCLVLGVFLAFTCEFLAKMYKDTGGQWKPLFEPKQDGKGDSAFRLRKSESKRKIVAAHRKHPHKNKSYSRESQTVQRK